MRAPHGETCFEVEWTTDVQPDGFGGCEPDTGTAHVRYFPNKGLAMAHAKRVAPLDYFGVAIVTPVAWTNDIWEYEPAGEAIYVEPAEA